MFVRESIIQPTIRHRESEFTSANVRPPFAVEDSGGNRAPTYHIDRA